MTKQFDYKQNNQLQKIFRYIILEFLKVNINSHHLAETAQLRYSYLLRQLYGVSVITIWKLTL